MKQFKRLQELNAIISSLSRKTSRKAISELTAAKKEVSRLNRIIETNPCIVVIR